jgi:hypothetical protein
MAHLIFFYFIAMPRYLRPQDYFIKVGLMAFIFSILMRWAAHRRKTLRTAHYLCPHEALNSRSTLRPILWAGGGGEVRAVEYYVLVCICTRKYALGM